MRSPSAPSAPSAPGARMRRSTSSTWGLADSAAASVGVAALSGVGPRWSLSAPRRCSQTWCPGPCAPPRRRCSWAPPTRSGRWWDRWGRARRQAGRRRHNAHGDGRRAGRRRCDLGGIEDGRRRAGRVRRGDARLIRGDARLDKHLAPADASPVDVLRAQPTNSLSISRTPSTLTASESSAGPSTSVSSARVSGSATDT